MSPGKKFSDLFSLLQFSNVHIPRSAALVRSLNCKKGGWLPWAGRPGAPGPGSLGRLEQESGRSAVVTNSRIDYFYGHCYCKIDGCPGAKGQIMSECIYEIIDFPKYHPKNLIDFCPGRLFRLGMLCIHLSRVALTIIKTNHM